MHGSAHAPKDYQVRELNVALAVGGRNKVLRVTGERVWERWAGGLRPTEPLPFSRMPVTYERAFGGFAKDGSVWEPRNPAGTGISRSDIELVGRQAPNIELARAPIRAWPSRSTPAGFGPIARHWQPRAALSGTYDADWEENRAPLLPVDFDERFFFAAPPDQQFDPPLMGNETIRLTHLTPEGTEEFRLPRAALGITSIIRGKPVYRRPVLRTIIIQPDERRVVLVWHDALPCHGRKYDIDRTEIIEKAFI